MDVKHCDTHRSPMPLRHAFIGDRWSPIGWVCPWCQCSINYWPVDRPEHAIAAIYLDHLR